jgi:hypothetical protein
MFELGLGLPVPGGDFKVVDEDDQVHILHHTSAVVGRARAGFELRF